MNEKKELLEINRAAIAAFLLYQICVILELQYENYGDNIIISSDGATIV